ncbi:UDP-glucuronosyltransferase 2B18-like [Nothobranchius furzeri]|uniref:UDP-glucuronosyltransferase 2B18-like n=1 Tax=Nothobranchius furzeri TaxID=105023 RepID=A0A9D2XQ28_NOTFU|nr:UDP-glucuronosyltransferase 2B18-like [Nothobranchius furzeri]
MFGNHCRIQTYREKRVRVHRVNKYPYGTSSIKFTAGFPTDRRPPWSCASACILLLFSVTSGVDGGKILVWYTEASHWINRKLLLETLVDRGHQVTVLVPSSSMFMNSSEPSRFNYQPFDVSVSKEDFENLLAEFIQFNMYDMDHMNYFQLYIKYMELFKINTEISLQFLDVWCAVSRLTDKINFSERTWNLLFYVLQDLVLDQCMWKKEHPPVPVR